MVMNFQTNPAQLMGQPQQFGMAPEIGGNPQVMGGFSTAGDMMLGAPPQQMPQQFDLAALLGGAGDLGGKGGNMGAPNVAMPGPDAAGAFAALLQGAQGGKGAPQGQMITPTTPRPVPRQGRRRRRRRRNQQQQAQQNAVQQGLTANFPRSMGFRATRGDLSGGGA